MPSFEYPAVDRHPDNRIGDIDEVGINLHNDIAQMRAVAGVAVASRSILA
ncbi:hypothetical protein ACV229_29460 [Burkholderia sp. MR1-5-21]